MKRINMQMILWLMIQLLIVIGSTFLKGDESLILFWMTLPFLIVNCIATIIILFGKPKTGSIIFLIGSIVFVPIGLIGVMGARKTLNKIKEEKFLKTL
ncbi:hypothetical protein ACJRPK_09030 [Aquimarina sp. 2-A2]|uniref:hypothetical protein n=1 Tax=Aquimarina sp. 2-A2 TaxID=3382644 RepID=UPI00387EF86C